MQKSALTRLMLYVMFCAPFVLLSMSYRDLPSEIAVLRLRIGHSMLWAPKSFFMVFRVPLMNLIHGLMAAVMLSRASDFENTERRIAYSDMFLTLLFAVALKSNFEAMEISSPAAPAIVVPYLRWLGFGALMSVVGGIGLALVRSRKVPIPWPELRLATRDKIALAGLFATYLAIVALSLLGSHRV